MTKTPKRPFNRAVVLVREAVLVPHVVKPHFRQTKGGSNFAPSSDKIKRHPRVHSRRHYW